MAATNFQVIFDGVVFDAQLQHKVNGDWQDVGEPVNRIVSPYEFVYDYSSDDPTGANEFRVKFRPDEYLDIYEYSASRTIELTDNPVFRINLTTTTPSLDLSAGAQTARFNATFANPGTISSVQLQRMVGTTWTRVASASNRNSPWTPTDSIPQNEISAGGTGSRRYRLRYKITGSDGFVSSNEVEVALTRAATGTASASISPSTLDVGANTANQPVRVFAAKNATITFTFTGNVVEAQLYGENTEGGQSTFVSEGSALSNPSSPAKFTTSFDASTAKGVYRYRVGYRRVAGGTLLFTNIVSVTVTKTLYVVAQAGDTATLRGDFPVNLRLVGDSIDQARMERSPVQSSPAYVPMPRSTRNIRGMATLYFPTTTTGRFLRRVRYRQNGSASDSFVISRSVGDDSRKEVVVYAPAPTDTFLFIVEERVYAPVGSSTATAHGVFVFDGTVTKAAIFQGTLRDLGESAATYSNFTSPQTANITQSTVGIGASVENRYFVEYVDGGVLYRTPTDSVAFSPTLQSSSYVAIEATSGYVYSRSGTTSERTISFRVTAYGVTNPQQVQLERRHDLADPWTPVGTVQSSPTLPWTTTFVIPTTLQTGVWQFRANLGTTGTTARINLLVTA